MRRRTFMGGALSLAVICASPPIKARTSAVGRLKQGVTRQVFGNRSLEDCCKLAASLQIRGFRLYRGSEGLANFATVWFDHVNVSP